MQDANGPITLGLDPFQLVLCDDHILALGILVTLDDLVSLHLRAGIFAHFLLADANTVPSKLVETDPLFLNGGKPDKEKNQKYV